MTLGLYSQRPTIELTFTAVDSAAYLQLDSIKVMNRTQGGETMIYWPDTALSLEINPGEWLLYVGYATFSTVGISEVNDDISSFTVYQNYPNPMEDRSEISMYIPHTGKVHMMITDLQGRVVLRSDRQLDGGHHSFRFQPGGGNLYFLTVHWNGMSRSIQMISMEQQDGRSCRLDYVGSQSGEPVLKNSLHVRDFIVQQSGILDTPEESTTYTFQFATNIPCPGTPTVQYEGQVYNTIQIFSQCWLKENLNVGIMIQGAEGKSNNGTIEKYCYQNEPDSCTKYGGLYQWWEMMQYTPQPGTRGICPPGWHLPTDEEWKVLEGAVDRQYGIGDPEWDLGGGYRGFDAGTNLKTTSGWNANGNGTELFGFSGLPGGFRDFHGDFYNIGSYGGWWSSTESSDLAWYRGLYFSFPGVLRYNDDKRNGFSVRCLRDYYAP
ncbi:MAG: FISUMP domain-containing protein [Bacteroidales bacterium]|nr:FISUMP domain-containing protein [Bacteroidales bacterium]